MRAVPDPVAVKKHLTAQTRLAEEAGRLAELRARGAVPEECGPAIPEAPARGAFRVFEGRQLYPSGEGAFVSKPSGFMGRKTIQLADAFDVMAARAASKQKGPPFTSSQVAMGRFYRDIVERHAVAGVGCSSLETLRSSGSGTGGSFVDAVLRDREQIALLRRRIGEGAAIVVRRVRPSARGSRRTIGDRALVDMVCLEEATISDVLKAHGWAVKGETVKAGQRALAEALERMMGPVGRPGSTHVRFGDEPRAIRDREAK